MKERTSVTSNSIRAVKEAVNLRLNFLEKPGLNVWNYLGPEERLYIKLERFVKILDTLKPKNLRFWINAASSVNYGRSLLDEVFPKYENPDEYHSREGVTCLNESPIQVLGWDEYRALHRKGVEKYGLDDVYISHGFEKRAEERGIDLEWSFHATVPRSNVSGEITG